MRIQETNEILKEARIARHANHMSHEDEGVMSRIWRTVSSLPSRVTGLWRHK
jgi:hypothetical protein